MHPTLQVVNPKYANLDLIHEIKVSQIQRIAYTIKAGVRSIILPLSSDAKWQYMHVEMSNTTVTSREKIFGMKTIEYRYIQETFNRDLAVFAVGFCPL